MTPLAILSVTLFTAGIVLMVVDGFSLGVVKHYGRQRRRGLRRLRRELTRWPADRRSGTITWLEYPSLSKLDIADLLWERRLAITGQDHRADGWPLTVGPASPADRPRSRVELLTATLREQTLSDASEFELDPVPFEDLERGTVQRAAEAMGWQVGGMVMRSHPMVRLTRSRFGGRDPRP